MEATSSDEVKIIFSHSGLGSTVLGGMYQFFKKGKFVDCVLKSSDTKSFSCHRVVLSSASPILHEAITQHESSFPCVIPTEVSSSDLCLLVEYIYKGKVAVPEDRIEGFKKAGEKLQICGFGKIDKLIPDVLEKIFSYLSASDVKNCALVCKKWDEAIGSSDIIMKKFQLGLIAMYEHEEDPANKELQRRYSTRKHQNVDSTFSYRSAEPPSPLFEHFDLSQVKQLTFDSWFNGKIKFILLPTLLLRMPLLEDLNVDISPREDKFDDADLPIVTLAKLKKLRVDEYSATGSFFNIIKASNIIDLSYTDNYREHQQTDEGIDLAAAFIKGQKRLVKLSISHDLLRQLFERHDFNEMRLLESLRLDSRYYKDYSETAQESLKELLLSNSLISLDIPGALISKYVLVAIFSGLPKLTTLEVVGDVNISGGSWMENLSSKKSLKRLTVTQRVMSDGFKKILQLSPNIETLALSGATDSVLSEVAASNRRLVELEISDLKGNITSDLKFNELKSLKIDHINQVEWLASLLVRCPKVETFECLSLELSDDQVEVNNFGDILMQQKTLKHLRLQLWPDNKSRNIFDKLKVNYGVRRSLTIRNQRGKNFIQFDFPENPAEWNVEEQEARFESYMESCYDYDDSSDDSDD